MTGPAARKDNGHDQAPQSTGPAPDPGRGVGGEPPTGRRRHLLLRTLHRCPRPANGGRTVQRSQTWPDWGQAFTAACVAQEEAERLSYRSSDGERLLFADLVARHYLPTLSDAAPNTRKNTASHLGDITGVPTRKGRYAERAVRSQLLYAFGHLAIGAIGPNEVQQWISQMAVDGYTHATILAKKSLLKTILQVAVGQGWLVDNVVDRARLPKAVEQ